MAEKSKVKEVCLKTTSARDSVKAVSEHRKVAVHSGAWEAKSPR